MSNDKIKKYTQFDISPKTQYQKQEILNPFVGPNHLKEMLKSNNFSLDENMKQNE